MHRIMKKLFILSLLVPLLLNSYSQTKDSDSGKQINILIVADQWPQMDLLAERLTKHHNCLIQKSEEDQVDPDLSGFDFVIVYVHEILPADTESALISYASDGGSLIVLHHSIASAKMNNPKWLDFLGIELFPRDHKQYPWGVLNDTTHTIVNLCPGHFLTSNGMKYERSITFHSEYDTIYQGVYESFELHHTEIFLNQRYVGDQHNILFGFSTENGSRMQPTGGWYKKAGKGRVFYYQAGHSVSDFENQNFLQILLNTLQWQPEPAIIKF